MRAVIAAMLVALLVGRATDARAQVSPSRSSTQQDPVEAARIHFAKGRDLYQAGSYREAIVELDTAHALDPKAKELVYNLAIVHEKLGEIDAALRYARLYAEMDLEPSERTRAETYIKRLLGAKSEVLARTQAAAQTQPSAPGAPPPEPPARKRGRIDVATIVVASVAVAAAGAGTVLGIKALADKPSNFVTGRDGATYAGEQLAENNAHTEAVVADACFGGAAAAAVAATVLYAARYKDLPRDSAASGSSQAALSLVPTLSRGGGGLSLGVTF
jgi:tetratricopeptide (TPR) repeat protein